MRKPLRTLNLVCAIIASVLVLVLLGQWLDAPIDIEIVFGVMGIMIVLFVNWWALFARIRFRYRMPVIAAQMVLGVALIGLLSLAILSEDDCEAMFSVVGIIVGGELFVGGLVALIYCCGEGTFAVLLRIVAGGALLGFLLWLSAILGVAGVCVYVLLFFNGLALYAFLRYRQARQNELANLLAAAATNNLPLTSAVIAYLRDRPSISTIHKVLSFVACVALPLYTYVRLCIGWQRFDQLVERLADRLEDGEKLSVALRSVPGVSNRGFRLLAAVGESTGSLGLSLQAADRERWTVAWLEIVPRLAYPFAVLLVVLGVTSFVMIAIIPKFKKIFDEFGEEFPPVTKALVDLSFFYLDYQVLLTIPFCAALIGIAAVVANPTTRWHSPIIGRLYRWSIQAEILRALGRLLAAGQKVPQALEFLKNSADFPAVVQRRLDRAVSFVERGEPLADALGRAELLSPSMRPLVSAAERARTLPWALGELGDHLAGRGFRLVRRISLIVAPLLVVAVAALVAFIALGMFMPLIHLLTRLAE